MLNKLPQLIYTLTPTSVNPVETADYISSYIENNYCENLSVDISYLNILDSNYVVTLASTKHYIKYPNGKITWKISSELIKNLNEYLELGNCEYIL